MPTKNFTVPDGLHAETVESIPSRARAQAADCAQRLVDLAHADLEALSGAGPVRGWDPFAGIRQDAVLKRLAEATRLLERLDRLQRRDASVPDSTATGKRICLYEVLRDRPDAIGVLQQLDTLSDDGLAEHLRRTRWPGGFRCRCCGAGAGCWVRRSRAYRCWSCGRFESLLAGTVLERSHAPLKAWALITLTLMVPIYLPATRLGPRVGVNRSATVRRLKRQVAPLCARFRGRNERLTLDALLQLLLLQHVNHEPSPVPARHNTEE